MGKMFLQSWKSVLIVVLLLANIALLGVYWKSRKVSPYALSETGRLIALQLEDHQARKGTFPSRLEEAVSLDALRYRRWNYQRIDDHACVVWHRTGLHEERVEVRLGEDHFEREGAFIISGGNEDSVGWVRLTKAEREARRQKARKREQDTLWL